MSITFIPFFKIKLHPLFSGVEQSFDSNTQPEKPNRNDEYNPITVKPVEEINKKETLLDLPNFHVVKAKESLSSIAKWYQISILELAEINRLKKICTGGYVRLLQCNNNKRRHKHRSECYKKGKCVKEEYPNLKEGQKIILKKL